MCVPIFWWIKLEKLGMTKLDEIMINYELVFWLPTIVDIWLWKWGALLPCLNSPIFARENASEGWKLGLTIEIWPFQWETRWDFGGPFMASCCAKSPTQTGVVSKVGNAIPSEKNKNIVFPPVFWLLLSGVSGVSKKKSLRHRAQLQLTAWDLPTVVKTPCKSLHEGGARAWSTRVKSGSYGRLRHA